jgi:L-lactate dehydrogenase
VGVLGTGHVGAHVANALALQGIADELYLVDRDEAKLKAEVQDLNDALAFCPHNVKITGGVSDYEGLADCDVIVNAAGHVDQSAVNRDGELFVTTAEVDTFAKRIVDAGFDGVWVTIANPCDVVATRIWELTGYPERKIIGSGTALDSSRLRHVLSEQTGIDQHSISGYILGEHGFSQFAAWSHVDFGGKPLEEFVAAGDQRFIFDRDALEEKARKGGYVAMAGKHCTEYAVACAASRIVRAVVSNEHAIVACSTLLTGQYGQEGIFASLPCIVGAGGVEEVLELDLPEDEVEKFAASCAHIRGNLERLPNR